MKLMSLLFFFPQYTLQPDKGTIGFEICRCLFIYLNGGLNIFFSFKIFIIT